MNDKELLQELADLKKKLVEAGKRKLTLLSKSTDILVNADRVCKEISILKYQMELIEYFIVKIEEDSNCQRYVYREKSKLGYDL